MADPARGRSPEPGRAHRPDAALSARTSRRDPSTLLRTGPSTSLRTGFTLVEVLVALAIVAVALAAGFRSVAQSAESATALKGRTLALWVAQNQLAAAQLETPGPAIGEREGSESQAGALFTWHETVIGTPNPAFRRVEITVTDASRPDYVLARLVGYVGRSAQR
ncbi:MAG: type II secretion system protein GspI [Betaproteobacteria bacterium]|nr:MAG: type II secretion system protein GspI [Betaproteobacteria bacterium]